MQLPASCIPLPVLLMPAPGNIVVVCTANICRSPMAEGLLAHALAGQPEPLQSLNVISAGVSARRGDPVSENSVVALRKTGIDISAHRSQPVSAELRHHVPVWSAAADELAVRLS